ncbi:hypothetical protein NBRC10512_000259 [Rhodotorula toruloides]|uniref:RHTO0S04e12112g1_1 n=2 Tax=Rhodotorula toruloides TaxID=5286 RepID=A0A061AX18_RHOTO|nr:uncharacterized protein RHTO_05960 [Rhodotorula toruloides NP11]EMS18429.1 hypothetical protein RHTO_05960 [Rhodotorula toruloides NP11]CDR39926.1 RHTO0S04e12112g1_1 [Rhodotorula toruloides]
MPTTRLQLAGLDNERLKPFPTPFFVPSTAPYTLQEIDMMALSYSIRSKPNWQRKYRDPEIRAKWRHEALNTELEDRAYAGRPEESEEHYYDREVENLERPRLTEKMVDYVLDELAWHDEMLKQTCGVAASCFTGIYESDMLVPANLREELAQAALELENNPPFGEPDWHPRSNEHVLDLVHPSLFPLVYGKSLVLEADGKGTKTAEAPSKGHWDHLSEKYAWLPSDFDVDVEGNVTILSYINNLHRVRHARLYPILAGVFERFIPLFEGVLSDLQQPPPRRIAVDWQVSSTWFGEEPDWQDEEAYEKWEETKQITLPEPEPFSMPNPVIPPPAFPLKGRKLHVIVKLANIHLTPEKPEYAGGVWHVEGMQNEAIVASGIYYFALENIGESKLSFRGTFDESEVPYEQNDTKGVKLVWGLDPDGSCVQYYNSLATWDGRAIAFPNLYQHRVSPFSLVDRSKPGYRKILCFFLVDPLESACGNVISTARVAPQQRDWLADELDGLPQAVRGRLPTELWQRTMEEVEGTFTLKEAKEIREDLMHERKYLVDSNTKDVFEREFSLCEH